MMVARTGATRDAVIGIVPADCRAEAAAALEIGRAEIGRPGFGRAVGKDAFLRGSLTQFVRFLDLALGLLFGGLFEQFGSQLRSDGEAGDFKVVRGPVRSAGVQHDRIAERQVERSAASQKVTRGIGFGQAVEVEILLQPAAGNTLVDDVDRAADGLTAVEEHGGSAQDLDPFRRQRVDGRRMVGGGVRDVDGPDPVDQHANTLASKAAQDRPRGTGRETGRGDARKGRENFAKLAIQITLQFGPFDDAGAGQNVELGEPFDGDDNFAIRSDIAAVEVVIGLGSARIGRSVRRLLGECRHRGQCQGSKRNGMKSNSGREHLGAISRTMIRSNISSSTGALCMQAGSCAIVRFYR